MATVHGLLPGISGESDGSLRLGCDPLHRHLLAAGLPVLTTWYPPARWCTLLRDGELDAALVSVAGMTGSMPRSGSGLLTPSSGVLELREHPAQRSPEISAIPLGRRSLVLIHADQRTALTAQALTPEARRPWQLLLPPADHQPLLWRQLERLGLLPLRDYSAPDCESWLQALLQSPHLLPAHLSLLEAKPWRDAGLRAVPPPEPLEESLWLLAREGEERHAEIQALAARLQEAIRCGMQPET